MNYINKLSELIQQNSPDTIEYIEDLKEMRELQQALNDNPEFRNQYHKMLNTYYLNNGMYNKLNTQYLDDEQRTFISLISNSPYQPQNRYRQYILNYYAQNLDKKMEAINQQLASHLSKDSVGLKDHVRDFVRNYYGRVPGISAGLQNIKLNLPMQIKQNKQTDNMLKNIYYFIQIGQCLQFKVDGFPKNQCLYLIYGMAVYFGWLKYKNGEFENVVDLIKYLQSYIQLNLMSMCFDSEILTDEDKPWSLVTFIDYKHGPSKTTNFRYQNAKNYITENREYLNTKLYDDEKGLYILTEMKREDVEMAWSSLECRYQEIKYADDEKEKETKINQLINLWFDSQLMTRSTCLIGCMLIMIFNEKMIEFKDKEMPDWMSILKGDYVDSFEFKEGLEDKGINEPLLNDVLFTLNFYCYRLNQL